MVKAYLINPTNAANGFLRVEVFDKDQFSDCSHHNMLEEVIVSSDDEYVVIDISPAVRAKVLEKFAASNQARMNVKEMKDNTSKHYLIFKAVKSVSDDDSVKIAKDAYFAADDLSFYSEFYNRETLSINDKTYHSLKLTTLVDAATVKGSKFGVFIYPPAYVPLWNGVKYTQFDMGRYVEGVTAIYRLAYAQEAHAVSYRNTMNLVLNPELTIHDNIRDMMRANGHSFTYSEIADALAVYEKLGSECSSIKVGNSAAPSKSFKALRELMFGSTNKDIPAKCTCDANGNYKIVKGDVVAQGTSSFKDITFEINESHLLTAVYLDVLFLTVMNAYDYAKSAGHELTKNLPVDRKFPLPSVFHKSNSFDFIEGGIRVNIFHSDSK